MKFKKGFLYVILLITKWPIALLASGWLFHTSMASFEYKLISLFILGFYIAIPLANLKLKTLFSKIHVVKGSWHFSKTGSKSIAPLIEEHTTLSTEPQEFNTSFKVFDFIFHKSRLYGLWLVGMPFLAVFSTAIVCAISENIDPYNNETLIMEIFISQSIYSYLLLTNTTVITRLSEKHIKQNILPSENLKEMDFDGYNLVVHP